LRRRLDAGGLPIKQTLTYGAHAAPEVVEGREVGASADLYSLGVILYEMVTGRCPVVDGEPRGADEALAVLVSPALKHLIERCLLRDPHTRWQSAADLSAELRWLVEADANPKAATSTRRLSRRSRWLVLAAGTGVLAVVAAGSVLREITLRGADPPAPLMRFELHPPTPRYEFQWVTADPIPMVSPDGTMIAYRAYARDGAQELWLRSMAEAEPRRLLRGQLDQLGYHIWSPDSRSLALRLVDRLVRIDLDGGPPRTLASDNYAAGAWSREGLILVEPHEAWRIYTRTAARSPRSPKLTPSRATRSISSRDSSPMGGTSSIW
jgi:hypothetical protein